MFILFQAMKMFLVLVNYKTRIYTFNISVCSVDNPCSVCREHCIGSTA